jgi:hypothetical protein
MNPTIVKAEIKSLKVEILNLEERLRNLNQKLTEREELLRKPKPESGQVYEREGVYYVLVFVTGDKFCLVNLDKFETRWASERGFDGSEDEFRFMGHG